jgi:hypothetical protein
MLPPILLPVTDNDDDNSCNMKNTLDGKTKFENHSRLRGKVRASFFSSELNKTRHGGDGGDRVCATAALFSNIAKCTAIRRCI